MSDAPTTNTPTTVASTVRARREAARLADIAAHPELYTTGKLVRKRRVWTKKRYIVHELDDDDNVVGDGVQYASVREIADARGLSHDTLRHVLANNGEGDRAGKEIRARRYREFKVTKL